MSEYKHAHMKGNKPIKPNKDYITGVNALKELVYFTHAYIM